MSEPFRNAKVGDKVIAKQFWEGVKRIETIDLKSELLTAASGIMFNLDGTFILGCERALYYAGPNGEPLEERPKKTVEKVILEGYTHYSEYTDRSFITEILRYLPVPPRTRYKIIAEVEE